MMPNPLARALWLVAMSAACAFTAGCAGTARGVERSVYQPAPTAYVASVDQAGSTALVVIRYPAMIHADAEQIFVSSFAVNAIGGEVPYAMYGNPQTQRIAQSVIAKSSYYAMSLYRELKSRLPEHSVLLSPHIVVWDEAQRLASRPILASEQVPAVLTVDFSIYSFPDVHQMMDAPPVTFGDLVTPLMVVRSGRWAQPALNGLLVSSEPLLGTAWRQSLVAADAAVEARFGAQPVVPTTALDLIAFLAERDAPLPSLPVRRVGEAGQGRLAIEQYPVEKIQMDGAVVAVMDQDTAAADPFERQFAKGAATRIQSLLDHLDHRRATLFARQAALARFDPELARVFFVQSADESVRARLQLAEALITAEREFLAAQSDSVYAGTYSGDYGAKMRKIIAAEYRMLEERRRLARYQNMTAAVATLALAGSLYGATVSTTASSTLVASLSGVSLMGSIWAMNRSLDARSESEEVNEHFIARMAPTFERQMNVQMEWLESKEVITARGFAEFRNKTLSLYQSRVRSMTVAAESRCRFDHPGFDAAGEWLGACMDGRADGRGYGVARDGRGGKVEYLGEAHQGRASGQGAMLVSTSNAATPTYFEGAFEKGQPEGTVRVEQAGEAPRWREFRGGRDVGRGDPAGAVRAANATRDTSPVATPR